MHKDRDDVLWDIPRVFLMVTVYTYITSRTINFIKKVGCSRERTYSSEKNSVYSWHNRSSHSHVASSSEWLLHWTFTNFIMLRFTFLSSRSSMAIGCSSLVRPDWRSNDSRLEHDDTSWIGRYEKHCARRRVIEEVLTDKPLLQLSW